MLAGGADGVVLDNRHTADGHHVESDVGPLPDFRVVLARVLLLLLSGVQRLGLLWVQECYLGPLDAPPRSPSLAEEELQQENPRYAIASVLLVAIKSNQTLKYYRDMDR